MAKAARGFGGWGSRSSSTHVTTVPIKRKSALGDDRRSLGIGRTKKGKPTATFCTMMRRASQFFHAPNKKKPRPLGVEAEVYVCWPYGGRLHHRPFDVRRTAI